MIGAKGVAAIEFFCVLAAPVAAAGAEPEYAAQRREMAVEIAAMARGTANSTGRSEFSDAVMQAMQTVPRHRFVQESAGAAYRNRPLSIGAGQTISQPYIVALSTELLDASPQDVVLEIGTGSGYQAAVLAGLVAQVYSIEIVESLGRDAASRLAELGYSNVAVRIGDGYHGWPEKAPFDAIVVTAAAPSVPEPLVRQLKAGGRMVIPVGERDGDQELLLIEKAGDGAVTTRVVLPVRFVPLTGAGGSRKPPGR